MAWHPGEKQSYNITQGSDQDAAEWENAEANTFPQMQAGTVGLEEYALLPPSPPCQCF